MRWLKDVNDDIYDPTYTDMLRVAFTSEFGRGKLQDLVALLSGRNFETKQYEEAIAEESFARLKKGVLRFINKTHFDRITMILRSAGFVTSDLIGGQNAVNFAYILYLRGRAENMPPADLERLVRRWYAMSILRGRYTGSPETAFDFDIRQVEARGLVAYADSVIENELPESFWTGMLPQLMDTSSGQSPYFLAYQGGAGEARRQGLSLSRHHGAGPADEPQRCAPRLPAQLSQEAGPLARSLQPDRQLRAGAERDQHRHRRQAPEKYFSELAEQCAGGKKKYGGITDAAEMRANLRMHCSAGVAARRRDPGLRRLSGRAPQADGAEDQDLVRGAVMIDAQAVSDLRGLPGLPRIVRISNNWESRRNAAKRRFFAQRKETPVVAEGWQASIFVFVKPRPWPSFGVGSRIGGVVGCLRFPRP